MKASFLCLFFLLLSRIFAAQDLNRDSSFRLALKIGVTRLDFFLGPELSFINKRLLFIGSVETGVNRTFFQQRVFPRVSIGFGYHYVVKELGLEPLIMISHSVLKLSDHQNSRHSWTESYLGYRLTIGGNWKFVNEIMGGWIAESYPVHSKHSTKVAGTFGYYGSIGVVRVVN